MEVIHPFCRGEVESINHLFFSCNISWSLWSYMIEWWNFQWCCQTNPISFFEDWCGFPTSRQEKKLWVSLFFVIIRNLWRIRNRISFENFKSNWCFETNHVKLNLGYWTKAWCLDFPLRLRELISDLAATRSCLRSCHGR